MTTGYMDVDLDIAERASVGDSFTLTEPFPDRTFTTTGTIVAVGPSRPVGHVRLHVVAVPATGTAP